MINKSNKDNGPFPGVSIPEMKHFELTLVEAFILSRLRYLAPKSSIERRGHRWVVWTIEQWAGKLVVSASTISRAIRKLVILKLIETEVHLLGGKTRSFIRPLRVTMSQSDASRNHAARSGSGKVNGSPPAPSVNMTDSYEVYERRPKMGEDELSEEDIWVSPGFEEGGQEAEEEGSAGNASNTECEERRAEGAWKEAWADREGTFCPSWTTTERRAALDILSVCREAALDPAAAIRLVVAGWDDFTYYANENACAYPQPWQPSLPWMAKWAGEFARWCHELCKKGVCACSSCVRGPEGDLSDEARSWRRPAENTDKIQVGDAPNEECCGN